MRRFILVCLACLAPLAARAQTLFKWPSTTVDVTTYRTVEQCYAALNRVRQHSLREAALSAGVWRDTMPYHREEWFELYPPVVSQTARQCAARWTNLDSAKRADADLLVPLFLYAGWDDKAHELMDRQLAAIPVDSERERLSRLHDDVETMVPPYAVWLRPPRYALAESVVVAQAARLKSRGMRMKALQMPLDFLSRGAEDDTALARRTVARLTALGDSMTAADWDAFAEADSTLSPQDPDSVQQHLNARLAAVMEATFSQRDLLDSLRRNTAAYASLRRSITERMFGQAADHFPTVRVIGKPVPNIDAEVWLGADSIVHGPRRGHVTAIMEIIAPACADELNLRAPCANRLTTLRRLSQRFPRMDVIILSHTLGHYKYVKDVTDSAEAILTRQMLDSWGVHGGLAMKFTKYFRLPAPDRRRVDAPDENLDRFLIPYDVMTLVDQDGLVVYSGDIQRQDEERIAKLVTVLLEREQHASR